MMDLAYVGLGADVIRRYSIIWVHVETTIQSRLRMST